MLLGFDFSSRISWFLFIYNFILAFILLYYSDKKIRKIKPDAFDDDFNLKQVRNVVLFYDYEKAFDLCLEVLHEAQS